MLKRYNGLIIPCNHPEFSQIKQILDRNIQEFNGGMTNIKFYEELGEDGILIPRHFPVNTSVQDLSIKGDDIKIESKIIPKNNRQKLAIKFLTTERKGILKLEPGSGKTVMSIAAICKIKKRTIVFVHKKDLRDQWLGEVLKFTNLEEDDVGILISSNFKKALKKPIILSTVQGFCSLLNGKHKQEFRLALDNAGIGIAFFDECHVSVGPEKFSACSLHLNCYRVFGCSATPSRSDGCDDIIKFHLGEITYYPPEEGELLKPIVYMVYFPFEIYSRHRKYLHWGGNFNPAKYYQQMYKSVKYNNTVTTLINKLLKKDRNVLVLGNRTTSLLTLAETSGVSPSDIGIFIPTAHGDKKHKKQLERVTDLFNLKEAFKTRQLVFSTYNACRDGNNRKNLDTLIMAIPTGNVEQAAGRVLRTLEGKQQPIVVDLIDTEGPKVWSTTDEGKKVGWFVKGAQQREEFYNKMEWPIKEYILD